MTGMKILLQTEKSEKPDRLAWKHVAYLNNLYE
jgi:hypothetical protein